MKKIKWIVFDYGGVVSLPQNKELVRRICRLINISIEDFYPLYIRERHNYDAGQYDIHTYWKKNCALINKDPRTINLDQLTEWDRQSWLFINEDTINYIKEIKPCINVALLSNMPTDFFPYIQDAPWLQLFEKRVLSFEEKICKPEKRIYEILLNRINAQPGEVLFIDDLESNVLGARNIGINSIQFINTESMRGEIEKNYLFAH